MDYQFSGDRTYTVHSQTRQIQAIDCMLWLSTTSMGRPSTASPRVRKPKWYISDDSKAMVRDARKFVLFVHHVTPTSSSSLFYGSKEEFENLL
jgi:hypothetical protein